MTMELRHTLDARETLPYTDDEIRELFRRARSADGETPVEERIAAVAGRSSSTILEIIGYALILYALSVALTANWLGLAGSLWMSATAFILSSYGLVLLASRRPIGPLSYLAYRKVRAQIIPPSESIDPYDAQVLREVVDFVAREPLRQAEALVQSIQSARDHLNDSLTELPELAADLRAEIRTSQDDGVRALLEAKHWTALETVERLRSLDREFVQQAHEAEEAVRPVRELLAKFDKVQRLSTSLARIQAAHGLIGDSEQKAEDHRLQLMLLRSASAAATARLREIQSVVEAQEKARDEVGRL
jgi:hypothetical protein